MSVALNIFWGLHFVESSTEFQTPLIEILPIPHFWMKNPSNEGLEFGTIFICAGTGLPGKIFEEGLV